jgi:hypothetical protein
MDIKHQSLFLSSFKVNEVLKPLVNKHNLKSYGLALSQITQSTMIEIGQPKSEKFWQGGRIFADTTSPL